MDLDLIRENLQWTRLKGISFPIIKRKGKDMISVKMVEKKLLSKYPSAYQQKLLDVRPLHSYKITTTEAVLLNSINNSPMCKNFFSDDIFIADCDLIVKLIDMKEFIDFIDTCCSDTKGGWMQINNTVLPYVIRDDDRLVAYQIIKLAANLDCRKNFTYPIDLEIGYLNTLCHNSNVNYVFYRNTQMIPVSSVKSRDKHILIRDLPMEKPFEHAAFIQNEFIQKNNVRSKRKDNSAESSQNIPSTNTGLTSKRTYKRRQSKGLIYHPYEYCPQSNSMRNSSAKNSQQSNESLLVYESIDLTQVNSEETENAVATEEFCPSPSSESLSLPPLLSPVSPLETNNLSTSPLQQTSKSPTSPLQMNKLQDSPVDTNQSPTLPLQTNISPTSPLQEVPSPTSQLQINQSPTSPMQTDQSLTSPLQTVPSPNSPLQTNQSLYLPTETNQSPISKLKTNQSPSSPSQINQSSTSSSKPSLSQTSSLHTNLLPNSPLQGEPPTSLSSNEYIRDELSTSSRTALTSSAVSSQGYTESPVSSYSTSSATTSPSMAINNTQLLALKALFQTEETQAISTSSSQIRTSAASTLSASSSENPIFKAGASCLATLLESPSSSPVVTKSSTPSSPQRSSCSVNSMTPIVIEPSPTPNDASTRIGPQNYIDLSQLDQNALPSNQNFVKTESQSVDHILQQIHKHKLQGRTIPLLHRSDGTKLILIEALIQTFFPYTSSFDFITIVNKTCNISLENCTKMEEKAFIKYFSIPSSHLLCKTVINIETFIKCFKIQQFCRMMYLMKYTHEKQSTRNRKIDYQECHTL